MTVQMPAQVAVARQDDVAVSLAILIEQRLERLADELEHADVVVYDTDRGLATRGNVLRMTVADVSAVIAEVAVAELSGLMRPAP